MNLDDIPAGSLCVIDTNVLVYAEQGGVRPGAAFSAALLQGRADGRTAPDRLAGAHPQVDACGSRHEARELAWQSGGTSGRRAPSRRASPSSRSTVWRSRSSNSFKPVYQMHKWFARRASCVFRAVLLGALKPAWKPDGTPVPRRQVACDVHSRAGVHAAGLPDSYPCEKDGRLAPHARCISRRSSLSRASFALRSVSGSGSQSRGAGCG